MNPVDNLPLFVNHQNELIAPENSPALRYGRCDQIDIE
jgi:hypothetical protein